MTRPDLPDSLIRSVFDLLDAGLMLIDTDRRIIAWNDWMAEAARLRGPAAVGRTLVELFPGLVATQLPLAVDDAFELGATRLLTHSVHPQLLPLRTRAGGPLYHNVVVRRVSGERQDHCLVQVNDVTMATLREQKLRTRQDARYRAVVETARDAIVTTDADGAIQWMNGAAARQFGYAAGEAVGRHVGILFEDAVTWPDPGAEDYAGSDALPVEVRGQCKDGSVTYLELASAQWSSDGRTFLTGVLRDINARKQSESALRHLNETLEQRVAEGLAERKRWADMFETTDALIAALDPEFRVLAVNPAFAGEFERLYGVRPAVDDNLLQLLAALPAHREMIERLWRRALGGEEFTFVGEFGDRATASLQLKFGLLRDRDGRAVGAFHFAEDVTDRLREQARLAEAERALDQAQKMEAIGQLTGGVAHDFNNLLTPILGSLDILRRRGSSDERAARLIDVAMQSVERARTMVQRLLAFARQQPLEPTAIGLAKVVNEMIVLVGSTLGPGIRIVVDVPADLPQARADVNQLEMALLNLAVNARDAMPDGGVLTISARAETVSGGGKLPPGEYVRLAVADTGFGMDAETLRHAIEPFFSTKGVGKGTGLGLSMVHGLTAQLGGGLTLASTPGVGTTVEIWLPVAVSAPEAEVAPSAVVGDKAATRGCALLVDDEDLIRASTVQMLSDIGYSVVEASSGQEALEILRKSQFDLLVTDHLMPGITGTALARRVRTLWPGTRVLLITGYADGEDVSPDLPRLAKPFREAELAACLAKLGAMPSP